jgi:hypothetical protein
MNAMNDVAEARASALSLRASSKACTAEQGALKFRLVCAAESLDAMVLLALRAIVRIEQLEQQLAAITAESRVPAGAPIAPVIVGGVDVGSLITAVRIVGLVETASADDWQADRSALVASLRMARTIMQETFEDLRAASARGAS